MRSGVVARRWIERVVLALVVCGAPGCKRENPAWGESGPDAGTSDTQPGELSDSAPGSTSDATSGLTSGGGPGTDSGDGSTSDALSSGPTPTTGDATGGPGSSSDAAPTTATSATSEGSTGPQEPATEWLINYNDEAACDLPFWCHPQGELENGIPIKTLAAECFEPATPPPYELISLHYKLWGVVGPLAESLKLHVMSSDGGAPLQVLESRALSEPSLATVGEHALQLEEPIVIHEPRFCLVFEGGAYLVSAMGMAIDTSSAHAESSYVRVPAIGDCQVPSFTELFAIAAESHGNWCVDAVIRELL